MLVLTMWKAYGFVEVYDKWQLYTHLSTAKRPVHQLSSRRLIYELQEQEGSRTEEVCEPKNLSNMQYKNWR